jgi:putative toxin-antitoxin system antitoxin component (TIGR02293 family)
VSEIAADPWHRTAGCNREGNDFTVYADDGMQGHRSVAQADVTLGCPHDDRHDLPIIDHVVSGFRHSQKVHPKLQEPFLVEASGLTLEEVASSLDLSVRNLRLLRLEGRLAKYESDRLYRMARIVALAEHFIGSHKNVIDWLKRPNLVLGSIPPLRLLDTELGVLQVENVLGRIGYGGVS